MMRRDGDRGQCASGDGRAVVGDGQTVVGDGSSGAEAAGCAADRIVGAEGADVDAAAARPSPLSSDRTAYAEDGTGTDVEGTTPGGDASSRTATDPDRAVDEAAPESTDDPELSVVVVTYNEADRVRTCLESVLECCRGVDSEVILVDSNSTDETVEIACEYPITVLQIPEDDLTTPGAGRYVGTAAADGDAVLFVDGDVHLTPGWLEAAMALLDEHDDVAGIDGHLNGADASAVESVEMLHAVALYDADALDDVGGFDPHLRALEDIELGARFTATGYRLLRLPEVVGEHPVASGTSEVARRWRRGYYFGLGQAVRKSCSSVRTLLAILARYRYPLACYAWIGVGGIAALGGVVALATWLVITAILALADVAWEGRRQAAQRVSEYAILPIGFLRGAVMAPRAPSAYPIERAVTVQEADRTCAEPARDRAVTEHEGGAQGRAAETPDRARPDDGGACSEHGSNGGSTTEADGGSNGTSSAGVDTESNARESGDSNAEAGGESSPGSDAGVDGDSNARAEGGSSPGSDAGVNTEANGE